jgi:DNA/RNA-binding domain of Phe-tRNA-synthetase-like protein
VPDGGTIVTLAPELEGIVGPVWFVAEGVRALERDSRLDDALRTAAAAMRARPENAAIVSAVRTMYKRVGIDPTKTRPSSEALLRRVRKGGELPRINTLVDIVNWCSLDTQLPFGLYDADRLQGTDVTLRLGREGEEYAGIRKDAVHVSGRLTLADAGGPFGNPSSDSARTMVTPATTRVFVVIFAPAAESTAADRALALTRDRIDQYGR